ncbi:hypothetical protein JSY36_14050 [Bacillus sp. H-16]|uniref:hypothetical protein n=1 Tax=Alteribacter salitolerans TaxID=2912333 RepID=UPI0019622AC5|nr:hypothetical protein [Alteribacter salitolerans]MBM7096854.1 hypothetical protein [Alteribacter salitolerans]
MDKYIDVMKQSVTLTGTIIEGLQHIQKELGEGKLQDTVFLFEDVVAGFLAVENSLMPVKEELEMKSVEENLTSLKNSLELVVTAYEAKDIAKVQELMQFTLVPQVKKLKEELEDMFQPYVTS